MLGTESGTPECPLTPDRGTAEPRTDPGTLVRVHCGAHVARRAVPPLACGPPRSPRLDWLRKGDGEAFWAKVREEFVMPPDLAMFNAANLCPSSRRVIDSLTKYTREVDVDPSPANRAKLGPAREASRAAIAASLRVTPEEIVITRNTSEANNLVSSGLDLKAGDEVLIFADNHPSNHNAWREKATRAGFTVEDSRAAEPAPGSRLLRRCRHEGDHAANEACSSMTHVTSTVGDVCPSTELCRLARERGVLTLVDGAQSFGVLDVDLSRDPARLLQRQRAQMAVRPARKRRAVRPPVPCRSGSSRP